MRRGTERREPEGEQGAGGWGWGRWKEKKIEKKSRKFCDLQSQHKFKKIFATLNGWPTNMFS